MRGRRPQAGMEVMLMGVVADVESLDDGTCILTVETSTPTIRAGAWVKAVTHTKVHVPPNVNCPMDAGRVSVNGVMASTGKREFILANRVLAL